MLVVVIVFSLILLVDYFTRLFPILHTDAAVNAANVIFGLAPASLFFMILVNYAMGTYGLMRAGALVHRSRSVESLAQATVICLAQAGILTGIGVEMEPVELAGDQPHLANSRIRQILGIYAHSSSAENPLLRAMAEAYPGSQGASCEEAPYLSAYDWSAISFDDTDLRGVYVLGEPGVLEPHLVGDDERVATTGADQATVGSWRRRLAGWVGTYLPVK